jgi:hypothetical protein
MHGLYYSCNFLEGLLQLDVSPLDVSISCTNFKYTLMVVEMMWQTSSDDMATENIVLINIH